ncbi:MAG: glycosyl hydrolase [Bacteroidales bacterium]|nr:glycosyl hydrolase [Bacteroidales bacterium]
MKQIQMLLVALLMSTSAAWATDPNVTTFTKNTETTVSACTGNVTLSTTVDYVITATSNALTGSINITNQKATVVFKNIKPSVVIGTYLSKIKINGAAAQNGINCRVEIYRHGAIVLPYAYSCQPLVVYDALNLGGSSKSDFNVNTPYRSLGTWDNAIYSFTLKRGYMVTMANHVDGTGYSHCFIANDADITVNLPAAMRGSVSFLRVFPWRWPSKKGYAGYDATPMDLMNVTWMYRWDAGVNDFDNYEYVPQKHHETGTTYTGTQTWDWPSWGTIDALNGYTHVLGQNEPDNTSGAEMYMTVENLIKLHKYFLYSGMRIGTFACCNPNTSWVKDYVDRCKAQNMRVDFVATHYYKGGQSPANFINDLKSLYDNTGLPVWVTEWNNGANWTTESGFTTDTNGWYAWGSGNDQEQNGQWLVDCLTRADNCKWLERLAIYNNVEQKRYVHWITDDHWTTAAGTKYGAYQSDFAYNSDNEYFMPWNSSAPTDLNGGLSIDGKVSLMWNNPNTDCTKTVKVQRKSGSRWVDVSGATAGVSDSEQRSIEFTDASGGAGATYRICNVDADGTSRYSNTVTISSTAPNGCIELTSLPSNLDDYYFLFYSKTSSNLCWALDNAAMTGETNYTSSVGTSVSAWSGASGTYGGYSVTTAAGTTVSPVELYNSSSAGTKISQTVNVPSGYYDVVMCATSHNARGENGASLNGTRDNLAYVFATTADGTKKTYFRAQGVSPGLESGEPYECTISNVKVMSNGVLSLGLGLEQAGQTGWHTLQIKSLTRTGDVSGESSVSNNMAIHYATKATIGTDLAQAWEFAPNGSGYELRTPAYHDYVLLGSSVQTSASVHAGGESCYLPEYNSSGAYWTLKYVNNSKYLGLDGTTPTAGAQISGTGTTGDRLYLYAIKKSDFNRLYVQHNASNLPINMNYTIHNDKFTWGTYNAGAMGSGANNAPNRWAFAKMFDGWNDTNVVGATIDGNSYSAVNVWAAVFTYAELSQKVTGLPNGVYHLKGYFATTNGTTAQQSVTALYGAPTNGDYIGRSENITGAGDNTFNPYEVYVRVDDNEMTVGVRSDGRWFKFANLTMEYLGDYDAQSATVKQYVQDGINRQKIFLYTNRYNSLDALYTTLFNAPMYKVAKQTMLTCKQQADTDYNNANFESLGVSLDALEAAIEVAQASADEYAKLTAALNRSSSLKTSYSRSEGASAYQAAYNTVNGHYTSGDYLDSEVPDMVILVKQFTNQYLMSDIVALNTASESNPVEITAFILENPSFENNTAEGWVGAETVTAVREQCTEFYDKNFELSQLLYGMPSGSYRLEIQGFYRYGNQGAHYNAYTGHTLAHNAYLFLQGADGTSARGDIAYISDDPSSNTSTGGWTSDYSSTYGGSVPNDMTAAASAFSQNKYLPTEATNFVVGRHVASDMQALQLGLRNTSHVSADWAIFTTFKLYYLGNTVTLDEESGTAPEAISDVNIDFRRKMVASSSVESGNAWNTICFPFALSADQISSVFGSGTVVKELTSVDAAGSSASLHFTEVTAIEANKPYIMQVAEGQNAYTIRNVNVAPSTDLTVTVDGVQFVGNYVYPKVMENKAGSANGTDYYILNDQFKSTSGKTKIKGFRAYFHVPASSGIKSLGFHDDEATAIEEMNNEQLTMNNSPIYDLSGRRVSRPSRGLYLVNGKKVLLK